MERQALTIVALVSLRVVVGCAGNQSGTESDRPGVRCEVVDETPLTPNGVTEFGAPAEVAEHFAAPSTARLRWYSHDAEHTYTDTEVTQDLTVATENARYLEHEDPCEPALELEAMLSFTTQDGTFAEHVPGVLRRESTGDRFTGQMPLEALAGSYDARWLESEYVEPVLVFRIWLSLNRGSLSTEEGDETREGIIASASIADWGNN